MESTNQESPDLKQSFNSEIKEIIAKFVENKVSDEDIQIFTQSTLKILKNKTEGLLLCYQKTSITAKLPQPSNNLSDQSSPINIYLIPDPNQSNNFYQNYQYPQQYPNPPIIPNYGAPSPYQYSPNQFYPQLQPPIMNNPVPMSISVPNSTETDEKKSKKSKSKKDQKDKKDKKEKKDKKSEKKKEKKKEKVPKGSNIKELKHKGGDVFDGICDYLTKKTGGNIHDNGTIHITSNNIVKLNGFVDYKFDFNGSSSEKGNTYICFNFKNNRVQLTSYSILSFFNDSGSGQIKNWVIEVSNDNQEWTEIDRRENDSTLNHSGVHGMFEIKKKKKHFYQYIRIRQTGEGWDRNDKNDFGFNGIEFYGFLQEN